MTTNKPKVVAWEVRTCSEPETEVSISLKYPEWAKRDENLNIVPLIRLSDYEALQAETEKMAADWSRAMAECEKLLHNLAPFVSNLSPTSEDFDKACATVAAHRKQGDQP